MYSRQLVKHPGPTPITFFHGYSIKERGCVFCCLSGVPVCSMPARCPITPATPVKIVTSHFRGICHRLINVRLVSLVPRSRLSIITVFSNVNRRISLSSKYDEERGRNSSHRESARERHKRFVRSSLSLIYERTFHHNA